MNSSVFAAEHAPLMCLRNTVSEVSRNGTMRGGFYKKGFRRRPERPLFLEKDLRVNRTVVGRHAFIHDFELLNRSGIGRVQKEIIKQDPRLIRRPGQGFAGEVVDHPETFFLRFPDHRSVPPVFLPKLPR